MKFRPTYVPASWQPDPDAETITFERPDPPLEVGRHRSKVIYDGQEYPVTVDVQEDGTVWIRSDPYLGDD